MRAYVLQQMFIYFLFQSRDLRDALTDRLENLQGDQT